MLDGIYRCSETKIELPNQNYKTYVWLFGNTKTLDTSCKKNQLDAQLILSTVRQPVHVSGVSRPIIRRYNHIYTTIGTYYSL